MHNGLDAGLSSYNPSLYKCDMQIFGVTIQAVIARAFFARSNLVLNRKNHALGDCFTRKKRSFAVTPLFRVDG
jgi:hypothetical protein